MAALSVFGAGVLGLLLFGIIYKTMIVQGKILAGIGLLGLVAMVACGLIAVILFAKAKEVEEASTKRRLQQPAAQGETTGHLLPQVHPESIPSVTEQTTELLLAENKSASKES
ncbi:MAG: hypothetical protein L0229_04950 [Blastocatellia bacterium]|nr:hypothetical protein [Blastocatellia bacterium]